MALYLAIETDILAAIARPEFNAAFPPLSEAGWLQILDYSRFAAYHERKRLEFLGDSMMDAALARQIYKLVPEGSSGFHSVCASLLCIHFRYYVA